MPGLSGYWAFSGRGFFKAISAKGCRCLICQVTPPSEGGGGEEHLMAQGTWNTRRHANPSNVGNDGVELDQEGRTQCSQASARRLISRTLSAGWTIKADHGARDKQCIEGYSKKKEQCLFYSSIWILISFCPFGLVYQYDGLFFLKWDGNTLNGNYIELEIFLLLDCMSSTITYLIISSG